MLHDLRGFHCLFWEKTKEKDHQDCYRCRIVIVSALQDCQDCDNCRLRITIIAWLWSLQHCQDCDHIADQGLWSFCRSVEQKPRKCTFADSSPRASISTDWEQFVNVGISNCHHHWHHQLSRIVIIIALASQFTITIAFFHHDMTICHPRHHHHRLSSSNCHHRCHHWHHKYHHHR